MKPTAKQVAHTAGVSISAVSRAFTPGAPIEPDKRRRILAAAEALGYVSPARRTANAIAANTVTLVAADLLNPFYPMVLDTLARSLQQTDRQLLVYTLAASTSVDTMISQILAARPSAIIVTSALLTSKMAKACRQHQIKTVLLNRVQRDVRVNAVTCDNYQGGHDIGRLMIDRGHRKIGFIGGISNTSTHAERARGFRDALTDAGIAIHRELPGEFSYRDAYAAAKDMLTEANSPEAIFCCNDIMALAAIDAARERGRKVPHDLAIAGFDDIPMASWNSYRLTTIRQPIERMIQEALNIIDDPSIKPSDEGVTRILPGKLMLRTST